MSQSWLRADWQRRADHRLSYFLKKGRLSPKLRGVGPHQPWHVECHFIQRPAMIQLNSRYRNKPYPTDILSFPSVSPFRETGFLGELVICLPVLKAQARALNHPYEHELDVLLVHGILHLLGFDHERGKKAAQDMAFWEAKLLRSQLGLIERSQSGKKSK